MTEKINIIAQQTDCTVVSRYESPTRTRMGYQSEAALEEAFIRQLVEQGYEYIDVKSEAALIDNLRTQIEALNRFKLSDSEWKRLFGEYIANENLGIEDKTEMMQQSPIVSLSLDNGEKRNIRFIDRNDIHNNRLQVINQYTPEGGSAANRYDVTLLVNGLPMVHVELKRRGVSLREAFNQINRYGRESFWAGSGLFDYVHLFIISNGTLTKYYSNTTRYAHCREAQKQKLRIKTQSNSFEFTSYWADAENHRIESLPDFTATFLSRSTLLAILTRYCVFTVDKTLMVMRPYQIAATERILNRIEYAHNRRLYGSVKGGGYIWHTTGSGKTLTSFKTAQLATRKPYIDKVLFVVDRKDLDYQTMKEYNNFEKDCANGNSSTAILLRQLNDPECRIIITTIQKLSTLLKRADERIACLQSQVVIIIDECHRSQFGDMMRSVKRAFKNYYLFGFTGTPIFAENAVKGSLGKPQTTADLFGDQLHSYTIIDAINDHNVLQFKVDYLRTMRLNEQMTDGEVYDIDRPDLLCAPKRLELITHHILTHFARKTHRSESYTMSAMQNISEVVRSRHPGGEKRIKVEAKGFNALFAVQSTEMARLYYEEFQRQQAELPPAQRLRIATIFTYAPNEAEEESLGALEDENPDGIGRLDTISKEFLSRAIDDYNALFSTQYSVDGERFGNYYKDVSLRMKNKEIDLLIVVGMFLTGFDAKTLNTLWVDKNLRMQGLLQAFSRTNRILNSVKDCGNIVCFRNLQEEVNRCFSLFGDRNVNSLIYIRPFADYFYGYDERDKSGLTVHRDGYHEIEQWLLANCPVGQLGQMVSEEEKRTFIRQFGALLKLRNLLCSFDEFRLQEGIATDMEGHPVEKLLLDESTLQDYTSYYIDLREQFRTHKSGEAKQVHDDVVFELELVKQVQISIDYILMLVAQYHESHCQDRELTVKIERAIGSSPDLRDKRELIMQFLERINPSAGEDDIFDQWQRYIAEQRRADLERIITEEKLHAAETRTFMERAFKEGEVPEVGMSIVKILPPMPLFGGKGLAEKRAEKKRNVLERLKTYFRKYDQM